MAMVHPEGVTSDEELLMGAESRWSRSPKKIIGVSGIMLMAVVVVTQRGISTATATVSQEASYMEADAESAARNQNCSWEGENCASSKCCRRTGFKCWERTEGSWGGCSKTCGELKQFGGNWTCKELGGDSGSHTIAAQEKELDYASLFCFMVVTPEGLVPDGVKKGYEKNLSAAMESVKGNIFSCDGSAIYNGQAATKGDWKSIKNTDVFAEVWRIVKKGGEYKKHDWTVKVDTDAVFFPDRLRMKIQQYIKPPVKTAVYFHNIDFKFNFMGALEIMSTEAVDIFLAGLEDCLKHIGNEGGEDIFTMECLDALGVGHMDDFTLLKDKYSGPDNFNLFDVDDCADDTIAAFHPYKAENSWMGCYKVAQKINSPSQFTSCDHRWEGEACSLSSELDHPGVHPEPGSGIVLE